jgi:predicted DCC family thiol-disulfide oxidoreductase YuxK
MCISALNNIKHGQSLHRMAKSGQNRLNTKLLSHHSRFFGRTTERALSMRQGKDIILYDGVCNFCNTWVDIILRIDLQKRYKFAALQSDVGRQLLVDIGKDSDDISSVLLVTEDKFYEKSDCVLEVAKNLGPAAEAASATLSRTLPLEIRNDIYDAVAQNRYRFMGKRECRCSDTKFSDRFLS